MTSDKQILIDLNSKPIFPLLMQYAIPAVVAMVASSLYNIIDGIFIGQGIGPGAIMGLALTLPIMNIMSAFGAMVGVGGSTLLSVKLGEKDYDFAARILGNVITMNVIMGLGLGLIFYIFLTPILRFFGASDYTLPYARKFLEIILAGNVFTHLYLGLNAMLRAAGKPRKAMAATIITVVSNAILAPLFIFVFHMGVSGAALATILSQMVSAVWILRFLTGTKTILRLKRQNMHLEAHRCRRIITLGFSGFVMSATNSLVEMVCNTTLQSWGGDLYVGVMTVLSSLHEIALQAVRGLTHSAQPVFGFNYGAGEYGRVKRGIVFLTISTVFYALLVWFLMVTFPEFFIRIFNRDEALIQKAIPALHVYFFGFFMMALQFTGQSAAIGLGRSAQAIFFSIFRKVIIVVPLTILLPKLGFGVMGVFIAEPISNFIGGAANYITMLLTIWRDLSREMKPRRAQRPLE